MTNEEHLLENILIRYARTGDSSKESARQDSNWSLCKDPDSIYDCAIYIIDNMFDWDGSHLKVFFPSCQSKLQESFSSLSEFFVI